MLNIEDFKEEMLERDGSAFGVEIGTHKVLECVGYYCNNCLFHGNCRRKRWNWLLSEKKDVMVLIKLEYDILKFAFKNGYCYITRTESGHVEVHKEEPLMRSNEITDINTSNRETKAMVLFYNLLAQEESKQ